jgi:hypothetical protein
MLDLNEERRAVSEPSRSASRSILLFRVHPPFNGVRIAKLLRVTDPRSAPTPPNLPN